MATTKEHELGSKTYGNLAMSDYIRIVGASDNVSYKQLMSDVAQKFIEVYASSTLGGSARTVKAAIDAMASDLSFVTSGAGYHNSIYRGKSLGTSVSAAQWTAIGNGTFDDMFIGDYWTINSKVYRIAAFDYWYNKGDTACNKHHVVLVPDANMGSAPMNSTNITTGGYMGSDMYTGNNDNTGLSSAKSTINSAFSGHVLSHREYLCNAVTNGYPSSGTWADSTVELMNEIMVYGSYIFTGQSSGTNIPALYTIDNSQLPLFTFRPDLICNRGNWWLRDVVSASSFARVDSYGRADYNGASHSYGVRPAFGIYNS